MAVLVSEAAIREIASIVKQQNLDPETVRLRVGVKGGGCSGFSYLLDLTEHEKESDEGWVYTANVPTVAKKPALSMAGGGPGDESGEGDDAATEASDEGVPFSIRVICDPKSYLYLNGTEVDFKEDIMQRGFVFNNPNATATCGCGSSFSA